MLEEGGLPRLELTLKTREPIWLEMLESRGVLSTRKLRRSLHSSLTTAAAQWSANNQSSTNTASTLYW